MQTVGARRLAIRTRFVPPAPRAERPREAVGADEAVFDELEAFLLQPEPVQPKTVRGERGELRGRAEGRLPSAHGADADDGLLAEIEAALVVELEAVEVVAERPALEDGRPRQIRRERSQLGEIRDRALDVLSDRKSRAPQHVRFAHPVLRRRPVEHPDLVAKPPNGSDVVFRVDGPPAVKRQLGKAARVERPARVRSREGASTFEGAPRQKERHAGLREPGWPVRPKVEDPRCVAGKGANDVPPEASALLFRLPRGERARLVGAERLDQTFGVRTRVFRR